MVRLRDSRLPVSWWNRSPPIAASISGRSARGPVVHPEDGVAQRPPTGVDRHEGLALVRDAQASHAAHVDLR